MLLFKSVTPGMALLMDDGSVFTVTSGPVQEQDGITYKITGNISGDSLNVANCHWYALADSVVTLPQP